MIKGRLRSVIAMWGRLVSTAILAGLFLPIYADAKPGYEVHPGRTELTLPIAKRGEYLISVSANHRQSVKLEISGPSSGIEYSAKGRVSSQRIEVDFGDLGRIEIGLHLDRVASDSFRRGRCKGRGPRYGVGRFRGAIRVSGEEGVPEISVDGGRFYLERHFRSICKRQYQAYRPGGKFKRALEEGILEVRGKSEGRTVHFGAGIFALSRNPTRSGGIARATVYERQEEVRITRWVSRVFGHGSLVMSPRGVLPETVEVELPKPFFGRALYIRSPPRAPSWTGDLGIDLLGVQGIPLAGSGFRPMLCRGKVNRCLGGEGAQRR